MMYGIINYSQGWSKRFNLFLCLLIIICFTGCSALSAVQQKTKKVAKTIISSNSLIKKAAFVPFTGKITQDNKFGKIFQQNFKESFKEECDDILFIQPEDVQYPEQLKKLPRYQSGKIDNLALAEMGKYLGLNAIILVNAIDIDAKEKEKGILFFRDTHYFAIVHIDFTVYDTATGAKLIDESLGYEKEIEGTDFDAIKAGNIPDIYELDEAAEELADLSQKIICNALYKNKWQGYIVSVKNGKIILSSGRETGLKSGDKLDVFESGEIIKGKDGQKFLLPGQKTGEIKITAVFIGKAEAVSVRGENIKPGFSVWLQK